MKIKSDIIIQKVGNAYLAVAVGERAKELPYMVKMNESGAFLWEHAVKVGIEREALIEVLLSEYDVEREIAERDVDKFIATLIENGLAQ